MTSLTILVGAAGIKAGDELSFFYPSTEWNMAQGFDCFCGTPTCRGRIDGAGNMKPEQLEGVFLNSYIREMLEGKKAPKSEKNGLGHAVSGSNKGNDATISALQSALAQAKLTVQDVEAALNSYTDGTIPQGPNDSGRNGVGSREMSGEMGGDTTRNEGSSRQLSGEMGGDTVTAVVA